MSPEEIAKLWESIGKTGLTQYKLKVDLNQDCMELVNRDGGHLLTRTEIRAVPEREDPRNGHAIGSHGGSRQDPLEYAEAGGE